MTRLLPLLVLAAFAAAPSPAAAGVADVNVLAKVRMAGEDGSTLLQRGSFSGAPFGRGSVSARTAIGRGRGAVVRFTLTTGRGTLRGTGDCRVDFRGEQVLYDGTARITSGTGAYRTMRGRLTFRGRGDIAGERFAIRLTGRVRT